MKNQYGWEVGEIGEVISGSIFSKGSVVQFETDDGTDTPLWKLLSGNCEYHLSKGNQQGAYCSYDKVIKLSGHFKDWKSPTQEERDYFEMITGHKILWSEDKPLILS